MVELLSVTRSQSRAASALGAQIVKNTAVTPGIIDKTGEATEDAGSSPSRSFDRGRERKGNLRGVDCKYGREYSRVMPAGFSNHTCVYCQSSRSTRTGDHIFARSFFAEDRRGDLPKAPACGECGNRKSEFEHYLATVLLFGGLHTDARRNLETLAQPRLAKNRRLHRELAAGFTTSTTDGSAALPFDALKLRRLFQMIPMGLLWHHRKSYLPPGHSSIAFTPPDESLEVLANFFSGLAVDRIDANVGNGTFRYMALFSKAEPCLSMWFFQVMGGLRLTGDPESPESFVSGIVAMLGPESSVEIVRTRWLKESA